MRTESRELLAVGVFGSRSRIGDRIDMLLRRGRSFSPRASATGVITSAVVLTGLMLAGSLAPRWIAFAQAQPRLTFEVASIKPDSPGGVSTGMVRFLPGGRLSAEKAVLRFFIQNAYGLRSFQISGGPEWINSDGYDIQAKAEGDAGAEQMQLMMQSLLEDRFKLKAHREMRGLPDFTLSVAKSGLKLESPKPGSCIPFDRNAAPVPPEPNQPTPCGRGIFTISIPTVRLQGGKVSMTEVARLLSNLLGRPVIDKTAFTGTFDVHLEFAFDDALAGLPRGGPARPPDADAPSIFTAVEEQLGLKLESTKAPVEVLVIDHIEKPSEN